MRENLPKKLKPDAIVEAIFEARFDADPASVPEVFFGRFADTPEWKGFTPKRLPAADIPAALRRADPNFRYQPTLDLVAPDGGRIVRLGPQMLAYARRAPYPGWDIFGAEIIRSIEVLFSVVPDVAVNRLGLRYVNALRSDLHGINGINNLNLNIVVGGAALTNSINLNYRTKISEGTSCTVRIATTDLAQGNIPENSTIIADIDVFTNEPYKAIAKDTVDAWKTFAHEIEKRSFFGLLTDEIIDRLREE